MTTPTKPPTAPAPTAPDRPTIPTGGRSLLIKIYLALSLTVLAVFTAAGFFGWELRDGRTDRAPSSARSSPGGYRSYAFWHAGYHGGK